MPDGEVATEASVSADRGESITSPCSRREHQLMTKKQFDTGYGELGCFWQETRHRKRDARFPKDQNLSVSSLVGT